MSRLEQKEKTHESIIESACRILRSKGIGGARVADVMSGAGLTVGGFYAHFSSKEALVDAAIRQTSKIMRSRIFDRLEEKPAEARAEVVLKRYLSAAHRDDTDTGCPFPAIAGEIATTAGEHNAVLAEQLDAFADELGKHLPADSRRTNALGMIALMYGGLCLSRAVKGTPLSDEILKACRVFFRNR